MKADAITELKRSSADAQLSSNDSTVNALTMLLQFAHLTLLQQALQLYPCRVYSSNTLLRRARSRHSNTSQINRR
jgi:hypothetical protein